MGFETDGFDEFGDKVGEIADNARSLDGENEVSFGELFTDSFVDSHTDFETIDGFFDASPWEVEDEEDFDAIPETDLDEYVDEHTTFLDWEEMIGTAGEQWMSRQLGF